MYCCHYHAWWVSGRPYAVYFGECSIFMIEMSYIVIINKYSSVFIYV